MKDSTQIEACISRLAQDLHQIASYIISPDHTRDDLFQIMVKVLIERAQEDPDFLQQKDAYILRFASWRAKNAAGASYTYLKKVLPENPPTTSEDDDNDGLESSFDYLPSDCPDPESQVIQHEDTDILVKKLKSFDGRDYQTICLLYAGYSRAEIARELGITKGAVTQRVQKIASAIK